VIRTRARIFLAISLFIPACTDVVLSTLDRDAAVRVDGAVLTAPDAPTQPGTDAPVVPDDHSAAADVHAVGDDVPPVGLDVPAPPPDVPVVGFDVPAPPDVPVAPPDVPPPPRDIPTVCEACTAFAPVAFCAGTGACRSYAGCLNNCSVCVAPTVAGDSCSNAPVITAQGRSRSVFTTCGATDNLNAGCNRSGPDIAITLRVARAGRVAARLTVPEGVGVVFGYDRVGGQCRTDSTVRTCNNATPQRTQGFDLTLGAGDYTLYVVTTAPSVPPTSRAASRRFCDALPLKSLAAVSRATWTART
jgi:hypothetical protein